MSNVLEVHKVVLSTKKTVVMRDLKIKHQELAAMAAGNRAKGNAYLHALLLQKEILKQIIVEIDGKPLKGIQLEDLDALFTFAEYTQLNKFLMKMMEAGEGEGEYQAELVTYGGPSHGSADTPA